jgi:hypothetical protein
MEGVNNAKKSKCAHDTTSNTLAHPKTEHVKLSLPLSIVLKDILSSPAQLKRQPNALNPFLGVLNIYILPPNFSLLYLLTSATKYGPITHAAVQTITTLSTNTTYGALHAGTSCSLHQTA